MKKLLIRGGVISIILGCILALIPPKQSIETESYSKQEVIEPADQFVVPVEVYTIRKTREFSYEDAQLLMKIAQAEAGNQGIEGMVLIMAVVINRVNDEDYPDNIRDVIYQPSQFYTKGMKSEISVEAHEALVYVESGQPMDNRIIAFEVSTSSELERYFEYAYTVGNHNFYRKGD